jgi:hypothetical protein
MLLSKCDKTCAHPRADSLAHSSAHYYVNHHTTVTRRLREMLKNRFLLTAIVAFIAVTSTLAGITPAMAHHGWGEYDSNQTLNLTGTVQSIGYDSPHVTLQLQSEGQNWQAILAPPARMQSRGLPEDALQVGKTVTLVGYPHRQEASELRAERIIVDEQTVELR